MPTQDSLEAAKKAANASETPSPAIAKAKANKAPKKPRKAGKAAPKVSKGKAKAKAAQVAKAAPSANKAAPGFMVRASDIIVVRKRNALGPRAKCFRGKAQTVAANKAAQTKAGFGTRSKYLRRLVIEGAITLRAGK